MSDPGFEGRLERLMQQRAALLGRRGGGDVAPATSPRPDVRAAERQGDPRAKDEAIHGIRRDPAVAKQSREGRIHSSFRLPRRLAMLAGGSARPLPGALPPGPSVGPAETSRSGEGPTVGPAETSRSGEGPSVGPAETSRSGDGPSVGLAETRGSLFAPKVGVVLMTSAPPERAGDRLDALLRTLGADRPAPAPATRIALPLPGHVGHTPHGPCFALRAVFEPEHLHGDRPLGALATRPGADAALLAADAALAGFDPRTAVFLDLETTSLGHGLGNLPFLLGIAWFQGPRLVLEQWLLRDPDEEAAALYALSERLADAEGLVTYNGRTFDAPLLASRLALHHLPAVIPVQHLDLLPATRRLLGHDLPNCRLGTVEARHLGLRRVGDVTGSQVPAAWIEHQHGGSPHALVGVVKHNRDDILSLVALLDLLLARAEDGESLMLRDPPAALALAAAALKLGHWARAEALYARAVAFPGTAEAGARGLARVARCQKKASRVAGL